MVRPASRVLSAQLNSCGAPWPEILTYAPPDGPFPPESSVASTTRVGRMNLTRLRAIDGANLGTFPVGSAIQRRGGMLFREAPTLSIIPAGGVTASAGFGFSAARAGGALPRVFGSAAV